MVTATLRPRHIRPMAVWRLPNNFTACPRGADPKSSSSMPQPQPRGGSWHAKVLKMPQVCTSLPDFRYSDPWFFLCSSHLIVSDSLQICGSRHRSSAALVKCTVYTRIVNLHVHVPLLYKLHRSLPCTIQVMYPLPACTSHQPYLYSGENCMECRPYSVKDPPPSEKTSAWTCQFVSIRSQILRVGEFNLPCCLLYRTVIRCI